MKLLDQQTQQQISDLVNACVSYWDLRGIPLHRIIEMRLELEQHLQQAVYDGKSLEAVVGANPPAFAEEWAREMHPSFFAGKLVLLQALVFVLSTVSSSALIEHLLSHSPLFKLTFLYPWYFIMLGFFSLLARWAGFLSPRIKTREKRQVLAFAVYAFAVILFLLIDRLLGMRLRFDLVLLSWNWPITTLLLAGSIALFCLNLWLVSDKEMLLAGSKSFFCKENNRPVGRAQTIQYIKTFTLLVAIFDFVVLLAKLL